MKWGCGAGPFSRFSFVTDDFKEQALHWSYNNGILGKSPMNHREPQGPKEFQRTPVLLHLQIRKMMTREGKWLNQDHTTRCVCGGESGSPFLLLDSVSLGPGFLAYSWYKHNEVMKSLQKLKNSFSFLNINLIPTRPSSKSSSSFLPRLE